MIAMIWIALGIFIGVSATIPLRLAFHHARRLEWPDALGNFIVGVILVSIAAAQFVYANENWHET